MTVHPHGPHSCYCPLCGYTMVVDGYIECNTVTCPIDGAQMRAVDIGEFRISQNTTPMDPWIVILALSSFITAMIAIKGATNQKGLR